MRGQRLELINFLIFLYRPAGSLFVRGKSEKQRINLVWPNFSHAKVTTYWIDKLKMAIAMLDHVQLTIDCFFGLYTGLLHWLLYSRAGSQRGQGSWHCMVWNSPLSSSIYERDSKNNSSRKRRLFIGVKNYFNGLGVALEFIMVCTYMKSVLLV